ncbi:MAG: flagellin [Alphaproteobacteria bacterium]
MSGITLSAGVRQNLLALQSTADMMGLTQNRLATGKKVNTALDNPNSFFTAAGLNNRANDLGTLLDDMGQAVQTLKAADQGITAITKLVESAKAKANQALQAQSLVDRKTYANQYNDLLTQIEDIARDSGYNGKNLLAGSGNDLTVNFNEKNSSSLTISAIDYTDTTSSTGLNIQDLAAGAAGTSTIALDDGTNPLVGTDLLTDDANGQFTAGDTLTFTDGNGASIGSFTVGATSTVDDLVSAVNQFKGISASFAGGTITLTGQVDVNVTSSNSGFGTSGTLAVDATDSGFATDSSINSAISQLNSALSTLRSQSSTFGTNLTVVQNRQDFTKNLVNTLQEGSGLLTLADSNEEGANLLALQTRQQLSTTALSFATQADQNVLRLF